jgi:CheY-like chemotaxis protein
MLNLLNNAVKFTSEGGQIGMDIAGDPENKQVTITVWDTGIGIAAADMPRLFKPFVQLDSSTSRQFNGTGLGLSLVVRIAEMHAGSVSLTSEPGQGSRFSLHLPWNGNMDGVTEAHHSQIIDLLGQIPRPEAAQTILIAANPSQNSQLLGDFLTAVGYQVIYAGSGNDTLRLGQENRPDLFYVDMHMADLDGLKLIAALRADAATESTPIIAVSSLVLPGDPEGTLQAGANHFLQRPVQLDQVAVLIHSQLAVAKEVEP